MLTARGSHYQIDDNDLVLDALEIPYTLRVKDLPEEEKPREKLLTVGPKQLTIAELVAILWGVGTRKEDVLAMARRTMKEYGEKALASEHDPVRLAELAGIPLTKACQIIASFELGRRYYATQAGRPVVVRTARQAHHYLKDLGSCQKEQFRALYLSSRYQVLHDEVISIGSLTSSVVHPREVFQPAIQYNAVAVIVAHNHPSGVLEPTTADLAVTDQLQTAGKILGIDLLDHLIITNTKALSIIEWSSNHA